MAEEEKKETDVDIFQTIKKTNESLVEVLAKQSQQEGPTFVQPPAPQPKPPNFLLWAVIGIGALILFKKVKI